MSARPVDREPGDAFPPTDTHTAASGAASAGGDGDELGAIYGAAGTTLTWGFRATAVLLLAGLLLGLARGEGLREQAQPLPKIVPAILDGRASGLVELAIVAIVLTPVVTTLVVAVGFARLGDRRYALLSLAVLTILGVSIALALLA